MRRGWGENVINLVSRVPLIFICPHVAQGRIRIGWEPPRGLDSFRCFFNRKTNIATRVNNSISILPWSTGIRIPFTSFVTSCREKNRDIPLFLFVKVFQFSLKKNVTVFRNIYILEGNNFLLVVISKWGKNKKKFKYDIRVAKVYVT